MSALAFQYHRGGIYLPRLDLWLDPHEPQAGAERVFVSHAHADHIGEHREVITSAPTAELMRARLTGARQEHAMHFGKPAIFETRGLRWQITLLPAGHVFGSAMSFVEAEGESLLYSGDIKLRRVQSAEPCQPRQADALIMETTYGRPEYRFPPTNEVLQGVIRFCREAMDNDETPVLLGYSLGKSQELLCGLADAGLPLWLHDSVFKLTRIYERLGHRFPPYQKFEGQRVGRGVLIWPPMPNLPVRLTGIGRVRSAVLTGWAVDPDCPFRYRTDAAFPLSDHADFAELIEFVRRVAPKRVFTLHGFAADFAHTLRDMGFAARALSEEEQLTLPLRVAGCGLQVARSIWTQPGDLDPLEPAAASTREATPDLAVNLPLSHPSAIADDSADRSGAFSMDRPTPDPSQEGSQDWSAPRKFTCWEGSGVGSGVQSAHGVWRNLSTKGNPANGPEPSLTSTGEVGSGSVRSPTLGFLRFAETCTAIGEVSGKLEKVRSLAEYLAALAGEPLAWVTTWFTGYPFPPSHNRVLQLGGALIRDALCEVGNIDHVELRQIYLKHSDAGETALEVLARSPVAPATLTLEDVHRILEQLHAARGPTAKLPLLTDALRRGTPGEGKFLIKILTGDLRIGLKEGLVEEAVAKAFDTSLEAVKRANLVLGDIGETARLTQEKRLASASLAPFRPVKFMLASPAETAAEAWQRMIGRGDAIRAVEHGPEERPAVWLEDKYDGVRCQLHKVGGRVALYSRDLKEITAAFFEIADAARKLPGDIILDGELLAMRGEEVLPFADLQRRLGRRESDLFLAEEIPVRYIAFDLLWRDGRTWLDEPLQVRRQMLESFTPVSGAFGLARITQADGVDQIEQAFGAARARGNEGLMIKDPSSVYSPGRRGLAWLKLKKALASLDCVVVGVEYGQGKRKDVLSDYTFAVRDEVSGELKTIGKAYSGLTDAEIAGLTWHFLSKTTRQTGRYREVEPDTVLEIAFDSVQPSSRHSSGLAMRFPRIVRIRTDKSVADIDTLAAARGLVKT